MIDFDLLESRKVTDRTLSSKNWFTTLGSVCITARGRALACGVKTLEVEGLIHDE